MDYNELGSMPISQENRAGEDVRYDDVFEKIESEIAKLTSPSASGDIDWSMVARSCEDILQNRSKHLLVTVYLTYALLKTKGMDGLADGLTVISDLLDNFWETLYPPLKRMKARKNAIEWLIEKVSKELERRETIVVDNALREKIVEKLRKIDDSLNEKIEDAPLFYNLIKVVEMKLTTEVQESSDQVQEQRDTTPTEEEPPARETPTNIQRDSGNAHNDNPPDFKKLVSDLSMLTGEMIESKDYRSELFIVNRAFAWLDITTLPPDVKGVTMLPPPDQTEIESLEKLYDQKDYEQLLWSAESRITTYLFWLDLHYYVAKALQALGYESISDVILDQTLYFTRKLPNIENLAFSDNTPFANKMTKRWLASRSKKESVSSVNINDTKEANQEDIVCNKEGIEKLFHLMKSAIAVEDEVMYNIEICKCFIETSKDSLKVIYAKQLLEKIQEYKTQYWRPDIALEAYLVCRECFDELDDDTIKRELNESIALLEPTLIDN